MRGLVSAYSFTKMKHIEYEYPTIQFRNRQVLSNAGDTLANSLFYGYPNQCVIDIEVNKNLLQIYERERVRKVLGGEGCLKPNQLAYLESFLLQQSKKCRTVNRSDLSVDTTSLDSWVDMNPFCVSRETWEKRAYQICVGLSLDLKSTELVCDLAMDIVSKSGTCDIVLALKAKAEICDVLQLDLKKVCEEDCQLSFDLLKSECEQCDINLSTYTRCIQECGLGVNFLNIVCKAGATVTVANNTATFTLGKSSFTAQDLMFKSGTNYDGLDPALYAKLKGQILKDYKI